STGLDCATRTRSASRPSTCSRPGALMSPKPASARSLASSSRIGRDIIPIVAALDFKLGGEVPEPCECRPITARSSPFLPRVGDAPSLNTGAVTDKLRVALDDGRHQLGADRIGAVNAENKWLLRACFRLAGEGGCAETHFAGCIGLYPVGPAVEALEHPRHRHRAVVRAQRHLLRHGVESAEQPPDGDKQRSN